MPGQTQLPKMAPLLTLLLLLLPLLASSTAAADKAAEAPAAVPAAPIVEEGGRQAHWDEAEVLKATLNAIEAAVKFLGRHADSVNLDGAIGLRTVEGQSGALLSRHWNRLPLRLVARLTRLRDLAGRASRLAVQAVQRRTPVYFSNAGAMIGEHFWDTFYPTRPLPPPPQPQPPGKKPQQKPTQSESSAAVEADGNFDEKFSDDCIHEFYDRTGKQEGACAVTERCWRGLVLPRGLTGYSLTHQLFYLMNGVQANCLANLTLLAAAHPPAGSDGSLASVFDGLCGRVFAEARQLEAAGFPKPDRDLFMEQVGICGLAGYTEFAQWRWLPVILSWQRPDSGCYGRFPGERIDPRNFEPSRYGNYRRRRKRAEARIGANGCLSHRTSVALDALFAYVRRMTEAVAAAEGGD